MYEFHPLPPMWGYEILRSEVGSTLHGTGLEGNEDHDEMGIFVELPQSRLGLAHDFSSSGEDIKPGHYVWRSAGKTNGVDNKSQPHDTDLTCYSLKKYCLLAAKGNPSILLPLWAPEEKLVVTTAWGMELRKHRDWFTSLQAGHSFLGYMRQQRERMVGLRGKAGRVRVMPDGGVDWKYAMHMLRLGWQGHEFLAHGQITLPVPGQMGDELREVRQGLWSFDKVIELAEALEADIEDYLTTNPADLPEYPNYQMIESWMVATQFEVWRHNGTLGALQ